MTEDMNVVECTEQREETQAEISSGSHGTFTTSQL